MTGNRLNNELEERLLQFGISVIKYINLHAKYYPTSVADQVIRSSTSIGANYSEAQNASSRQDFRNKIYIAKKEASETRYWLRIIAELHAGDNLHAIQAECQEVVYILQKIASTLNSKANA